MQRNIITLPGTTITSTGTAVIDSIPVDSSGQVPRYVRITASAAGFVKIARTPTAATTNDVLVQPGDAVQMMTCGAEWISFISNSGTAKCVVSAQEFGPVSNYTGFTPSKLFVAGEPGAWYDPSDLTTLYQDAAGTTPVTAVEQPVGLMLDKSGRGNHAYQTTSASRPVLSARVNLLTKTEDFSDAVWTKQSGTTVSPTKVADPNGNLTAFSVTGNWSSGIYQIVVGTVAVNTTRSVYLRVPTGTATVNIKDPVQTQGTITCNLTATWQRFTLTETTTPAGGNLCGLWVSAIPASGIEVAWPDIRVDNDGVNLPPYQRVNTATDYDTAGFPLYLKTDGVDDGMVTNSIDFTGTDKMTVWAGVGKLSDATRAMLLELGSSPATNTFNVEAPDANASGTYKFRSSGSAIQDAIASSYPAPITNVLTGIGAISTPVATLRVNGTQAATSSATQGTGNYGNYPLYLFTRGGTSLPFNGRCYGLIVRGAQSSAAQIAAAEAYINRKTKAY